MTPPPVPILDESLRERFAFGRELGRGGFAAVYEAKDRKLGRTVAVKMLWPLRGRDRRERERFVREARALAVLTHPHIVGLYEAGELPDGTLFLVMEYCPGGSLAGRLKAQGPLSVEEAVGSMAGIARGVKAAHDRGILHRDIKPANMLLSQRGIPKLADFGIARDSASQGLTSQGKSVGTLAYMAPEQLSTGEQGVGPATDIWALGISLYELLAGRTPFEGSSTVNTCYQIMSEEPRALSELRGDVPAALEDLCRRCLAKESPARFGSAEELALALEGLVGRAGRRSSANLRSEVNGGLPPDPSHVRAEASPSGSLRTGEGPAQRSSSSASHSRFDLGPMGGQRSASIAGTASITGTASVAGSIGATRSNELGLSPAEGVGRSTASLVRALPPAGMRGGASARVEPLEVPSRESSSGVPRATGRETSIGIPRTSGASAVNPWWVVCGVLILALVASQVAWWRSLSNSRLAGEARIEDLVVQREKAMARAMAVMESASRDSGREAELARTLSEQTAAWQRERVALESRVRELEQALERSRVGGPSADPNPAPAAVESPSPAGLAWADRELWQAYMRDAHELGGQSPLGKLLTAAVSLELEARPAAATNLWSLAAEQAQLAAARGDREGQYWLGVMHFQGRGAARDDTRALGLLLKAAEGGHPSAQQHLGRLYRRGMGVPRDDAQAAAWHARAAAQGDRDAQNELGVAYQHGQGVPRDLQRALELYSQAARQGYSPAQCNLGLMYLHGLGVARDEAQAIVWLSKAAEVGNTVAEASLGDLYLTGSAPHRDPAKAAALYTRAATAGDAAAQHNLAVMYRDGMGGLPRDYNRAAMWFAKSAAQGLAAAQLNLGVHYEQGLGVPRDLQRAAALYRQAADQGHPTAQHNLAVAFRDGLGVTANTAEATSWFTKAMANPQVEPRIRELSRQALARLTNGPTNAPEKPTNP